MHGVLTDTHLMIPKRGAFEVAQPQDLGDICMLGNQYDVSHVWVLPGTWLSGSMDLAFVERTDAGVWDYFASKDDTSGRPMYARLWLRGARGREGRTVWIGFAEYCRFGWEDIRDPQVLLDAVSCLEKTLGVPVRWSPGHIAIELIKKLNEGKRESWVRESTMDLKSLPFNRAARDLIWKTSDLGAMREGLYLHQYDKNSAYLAAATGVQVGAGDPIHVEGDVDATLPGIYNVRFDVGESPYRAGGLLPPVINTDWVTPDIIAMARTLGYQVDVVEGWQFTEKHRTLESWAKTLWDARALLRGQSGEAAALAYRVVKQIALIGVGRLASKKSSQFLRPDWWACIVGRARATMFRKIEQLRLMGHMPVLIYNDSVYYLSPDPDPVTAVPGLLEKAGNLGGYKHEWTFHMDERMIALFRSLSPGQLVEALNERADIEEESE
jgi:hypothetical protein